MTFVFLDPAYHPYIDAVRTFNVVVLLAFLALGTVKAPRVVKHAPGHAVFLYMGIMTFVAISTWGTYQALRNDFPATLSTFLYTPASIWLLCSNLAEDPDNNWPGVPGFVRWLRNKED